MGTTDDEVPRAITAVSSHLTDGDLEAVVVTDAGGLIRSVNLTRREVEVLGLVAAGLANKEIALRLEVRLNTVRNHVQNILTKLQAHSKLEAVATAVREGILDYPSTVARG